MISRLPSLLASLLLILGNLSAKKNSRPNLIIIMADDMGWSDIGCYGSEIKTPNLDGLAKKGVRFTQFYNTGRCCPTRATLLSGTYAHQAGIGHMMGSRGLPGYQGDLGKNVRTIAEVMKTAGYSTYMAGKWHVTPHVRPGTPTYNWPRQRGFDRFYGTIHGAGSFFDPNSLTRENTLISPLADKKYQPKRFYYTDAINDHAARYLKEHKGDQPFFMYVAHTAPHWPMHALPEDVAKYKGKYDKGWEEMRKARYQRQLKMGLIEDHWKMSPKDSRAPDWKDAKNKEWEIQLMEVYAAMVDRLDQGVGTIVTALKESGQYDNTLIFFLADNGGCAEGMGRRGGIQYREKNFNEIIPMAEDALQPGQQRLQVSQVRGADPHSRGLVRIGRAYAPAGRANRITAPGFLRQLIQHYVVRHHQVRLVADVQAPLHVHLVPLQSIQLAHQARRVNHHPVADDALLAAAQDA